MNNEIKFYYNGLKVNGGKLQKYFLSDSSGWCVDGKVIEGGIVIYKRGYDRFSKEVRDVFDVKNDTDTMTDYFEEDSIRIMPDHPLYKEVKKALGKKMEHDKKADEKRTAR